MPFLCPECNHPQLNITNKIELGPDSRSDEIMLQIIKCFQCGFYGIAVYEESRRGSLNNESYSHFGFRVSPADLQALRELIKHCPEPDNRRCECFAHHTLNVKDISGRWNALADVHLDGRFEIER